MTNKELTAIETTLNRLHMDDPADNYPDIDDLLALCAEVRRLQAENERLRALAVPLYSGECPTEPGWYWFKNDEYRTRNGVAQIFMFKWKDGDFLAMQTTDDLTMPLDRAFRNGYRFARIPNPPEVKDADKSDSERCLSINPTENPK